MQIDTHKVDQRPAAEPSTGSRRRRGEKVEADLRQRQAEVDAEMRRQTIDRDRGSC